MKQWKKNFKPLVKKQNFKQLMRTEAFIKTGGKCFYCSRSLNLQGNILHEDYMTLDHYIPKSKGGTIARENIVPACHTCNKAKSNLLPDEFFTRG